MILNFFKKRKGTGALLDVRTSEARNKDFHYDELFSYAGDLALTDWETWKNNFVNQQRLNDFEVYDQNGSSSCVSHSAALILSIQNYFEEAKFLKFSPRDFYARRVNKPQSGMGADDIGKLMINNGATLGSLLPGEQMNESQMNDVYDYKPSYGAIAKIYKAKSFIYIPLDYQKIASVLADNKPVNIFVRFAYEEWTQNVPQVTSADPKYGHSVVILPNAYFSYQGKPAFLIQDSWGVATGMNGRRILTKDWIDAGRLFSAFYYENLDNLAILNSNIDKPKYVFTKVLQVGSTGNDVSMLQRCLGYLTDANGYLFPLAQPSTGYYGGITRNAVQRYQKLKNLPITGIVDIATMQQLNIDFV